MALRKFLYQSTEGYPEEQATSDSLALAGLTMSGAIAMGSNKITGLGSATGSGDALAYGQSGASLAGLALTANLDLSTLYKVVNSAAPSNAADLTNKSYVDTAVVTGGQIKEAIFCSDQLSNTQGIRSAEVLYFLNQPVAGDTVTFKNASLTRTYTFVANIGAESAATDVSIETSALTAMQRLATRMMADVGNTQWDAGAKDMNERLSPAPPSGTVVFVWKKTSGAGIATSRIYGTVTTANDFKIIRFQTGGVVDRDYQRITAITMPSTDPAEGNFGFQRQVSELVDGELHFDLHHDSIYAWDADAVAWNAFSGTGAIPDATSGAGGGTKGKVTVDEDYALYVTTGILRMALLSTGGLQFNAGTPKTLGIKLDTNPGLALSGTGLKGVVTASKGLTITGSGFEVVADTARAIATDGSGVYLMLASNPGLEFNGVTGVQAKIFSTGGLQRDGNGLSIKNDVAGGLTSTASGEKVNLEASNPTLKIDGSNQLGVKYDTTKGLNTSLAGMIVKVDGSTITFDGSGNLQAATVAESKRIENTINVDVAVNLGDPVYITATGDRVSPADTDTDAKSRVIGIARTAQAVVGSPTEVVQVGLAAGVLSGATAGTPYYLATGGGLSTSAPGSGKRVIQVGVALNATDLIVRIMDYGKRA